MGEQHNFFIREPDVHREPLSVLDKIVIRRVGLTLILFVASIIALASGHPFVGYFLFFWSVIYGAITIARLWLLHRRSRVDKYRQEH